MTSVGKILIIIFFEVSELLNLFLEMKKAIDSLEKALVLELSENCTPFPLHN